MPTSDSASPAAIPPVVLTAAGRWAGGEVHITLLAGDASPRTYYRVSRVQPAGGQTASMIVADHHGPFDPLSFPFLQTTELFTAAGMPVPGLLHCEPEAGLLLLEDLGDDLLQSIVARAGGAGSPAVQDLYREAIDLVHGLQARGTPSIDAASQAGRLALDGELFRRELDHFFEHLVVRLRGHTPSLGRRQQVTAAFTRLCARLDAEPRVLCHRDYHSRNLLVAAAGHLVIIDHQDARRGPDTYDLVSLLDDPYVERPDAWRDEMAARFLSGRHAAQRQAAPPEDAAAFRSRLDAMAAQRLLKAAGTYAAQHVLHGRAFYLDYLPAALERARLCLAAHDEHADLLAALAPLIPELEAT